MLFQSRKFDFGMNLSKDELDKVNFFRNNNIYQDRDAVINVLNDYKKKIINNISILFDFEANTKGCCCYDNIVIKLYGIVNYLKYLYSQYKCTIKQYYTHGRTSASSTRQRPLRPKTLGSRLIYSALSVM